MTARSAVQAMRIWVMCALVVVASGCAVQSMAVYDETTDKNVTALQRKVETFLFALQANYGLPECAYTHNRQFYTSAQVDLSSIQVRAQAIPRNETTVQQLRLLANSIELLETLHKHKDKKPASTRELKCLTANEIGPLRTALNSSFTAILKLELAKKRN